MKANLLVSICCILFLGNCTLEKKEITNGNELYKETSPYLLQHAKNPVHWKAWNDNTLKSAKELNKLIIISVGYSACHWCHVMEEESFANDSIAKIMNDNFINIKVDREERPDVDGIYMDAVQLMTGKGGWPLNCIALPDGRPIFGGTYFTKNEWIKILKDISKLYKESPEKVYKYAENLTQGVKKLGLITLNKEDSKFTATAIKTSINTIKTTLDFNFGGANTDIKFPMPVSLEFLQRYAYHFKDDEITSFVNRSLSKMAFGGIYDQINGGFSRYATDKKWHIPHFEKMLYDNAQLVSIYAKAYQETKNELYKSIIKETLDFVKTELTDTNGAFYSSLDADSKNANNKKEEGAYYSWTEKELTSLIKTDYTLFKAYYNINDYGLWEDEKYVLILKVSDADFAKKHNISKALLQEKVTLWKNILKSARKEKTKPNLDDKILTSWNALMLKGYVDAYKALGDKNYLQSALKNANFITNNLLEKEKLFRNYKDGKATIEAYSEDYATVIDAFMNLYEVTFDEKWLHLSKKLMNYTIKNYLNTKNSMFYFTSNSSNNLISRKVNVIDGVIASSNSLLANSLFKLHLYFSDKQYEKIAKQMLNNVKEDLLKNPSGYYNWLNVYLNYTQPFFEVVFVGEKAKERQIEFSYNYVPNIIIAGSSKENNDLMLTKNKFVDNETLIYVCNLGACKLPQTKVTPSLRLISK